jgi:hypothetical protein
MLSHLVYLLLPLELYGFTDEIHAEQSLAQLFGSNINERYSLEIGGSEVKLLNTKGHSLRASAMPIIIGSHEVREAFVDYFRKREGKRTDAP